MQLQYPRTTSAETSTSTLCNLCWGDTLRFPSLLGQSRALYFRKFCRLRNSIWCPYCLQFRRKLSLSDIVPYIAWAAWTATGLPWSKAPHNHCQRLQPWNINGWTGSQIMSNPKKTCPRSAQCVRPTCLSSDLCGGSKKSAIWHSWLHEKCLEGA